MKKEIQTNKIGWKEVELGEVCELIMGQSPPGESYNTQNQGTPLLNGAADFNDKKIIPKQFTTKPTKLSKKGDILFCIRATIGKSTISDKELVYRMNRHSGTSAQEIILLEMNRRLKQEIEEFNINSSKQSEVMTKLTRWIAVLTIAMLIIGVIQIILFSVK